VKEIDFRLIALIFLFAVAAVVPASSVLASYPGDCASRCKEPGWFAGQQAKQEFNECRRRCANAQLQNLFGKPASKRAADSNASANLPAPALDSTSTPREKNTAIDALLADAPSAIKHDSSLVSAIGIGATLLCVFVVAATVYAINLHRKHQQAATSLQRTALVVLLLALPLIAISIGAYLMTDGLLQTSRISVALGNDNTRPALVGKGDDVTIVVPISIDPSFSYSGLEYVSITRATATRPSGEQVPVNIISGDMTVEGRKSATFRIERAKDDVKLHVELSVPNDPSLSGALIELAFAGSLNLIAKDTKQSKARRYFTKSSRFRVARQKELDFQLTHWLLSDRLATWNAISFSAGTFAIFGFILVTHWQRRKGRAVAEAGKRRE